MDAKEVIIRHHRCGFYASGAEALFGPPAESLALFLYELNQHTSTPQRLNSSTAQQLNTSTPQQLTKLFLFGILFLVIFPPIGLVLMILYYRRSKARERYLKSALVAFLSKKGQVLAKYFEVRLKDLSRGPIEICLKNTMVPVVSPSATPFMIHVDDVDWLNEVVANGGPIAPPPYQHLKQASPFLAGLPLQAKTLLVGERNGIQNHMDTHQQIVYPVPFTLSEPPNPSTPQQLNSSTPQLFTPSISQPPNTSTPQPLNFSTFYPSPMASSHMIQSFAHSVVPPPSSPHIHSPHSLSTPQQSILLPLNASTFPDSNYNVPIPPSIRNSSSLNLQILLPSNTQSSSLRNTSTLQRFNLLTPQQLNTSTAQPFAQTIQSFYSANKQPISFQHELPKPSPPSYDG